MTCRSRCLLKDIWLYALSHYRLFDQFLADAHTGSLPNYSFIEPRYFTDLFKSFIPNDEHPPHNVLYGEQLIAAVYNAVRSSPCWKKTLLIITYDEHGGCYDHVPPPKATPPDGLIANPLKFDFDTYGVRVPAVIISPYIPPGSKVRPVPAADGSTTPFDHTSIIKTVRELFALGGKLTARDDGGTEFIECLEPGSAEQRWAAERCGRADAAARRPAADPGCGNARTACKAVSPRRPRHFHRLRRRRRKRFQNPPRRFPWSIRPWPRLPPARPRAPISSSASGTRFRHFSVSASRATDCPAKSHELDG